MAKGIYGDGSIFKRADGMYVARLELGRDLNQNRVRWQGTSRTQAGALKKLREARNQRDTVGFIPAKGKSLTIWLEHWLTHIVKPTKKPKTTKDYTEVVKNHLIPRLGRVALSQLTPAHVRNMHTDITRERSLGTANKVVRVLRATLSDAEREGLVVRNVAKLVKTQSVTTEREALTHDEAHKFLRYVKGTPMGARWAMAILTGARQGECLGLTWDRVDLEQKTIDISWQLQRLPMKHGCQAIEGSPTCGKKRASACPSTSLDVPDGYEYRQIDGPICLTKPKTDASERLIPIPTELADALTDHGLANMGTKTQHNLVWTRLDGRWIDSKEDSADWKTTLKAAAIDHDVPLHSARHTAATLLMEQGASETVIQSVLGHSDAMTSRIYMHADLTMARKALDGLSKSLA